MKHLKTFESIYENPLVIELKYMALELTDMGYNVQIFKDRQEIDDNIRIIITHGENYPSFTMMNILFKK